MRKNGELIMSEMTFLSLANEGQVSCSDCGFRTKLIVPVRDDSEFITNYQCRDCGEIQQRKNALAMMLSNACDCGGVLLRDAPLFCPECKSAELKYQADAVN